MPTPMSAYAEIAARYGVDPLDDEAVNRFFSDTAQTLDPETRQAIFDELFYRDGEPEVDLGCAIPSITPADEHIDFPTLRESPPVPASYFPKRPGLFKRLLVRIFSWIPF